MKQTNINSKRKKRIKTTAQPLPLHTHTYTLHSTITEQMKRDGEKRERKAKRNESK